MAIDYSNLRRITARELINALLRDDFVLDRQRGSHRHYYHPADKRRVTVSFHRSGQTFAPKTLRVIIEQQAKWQEDDLRRLRLIK
jgi:predicted RNA binding protein YcfA (HicA-like mRNA interferase family)